MYRTENTENHWAENRTTACVLHLPFQRGKPPIAHTNVSYHFLYVRAGQWHCHRIPLQMPNETGRLFATVIWPRHICHYHSQHCRRVGRRKSPALFREAARGPTVQWDKFCFDSFGFTQHHIHNIHEIVKFLLLRTCPEFRS